MKKLILILLGLGLFFMVFSMYYANKSSRLIEQFQQDTFTIEGLSNEAENIENRLLSLEDNTEVNYPHLELNSAQFKSIKNCLEIYNNLGTLAANCDTQMVDIILQDYGEKNYIKSIIGASIAYNAITYNHNYLQSLFKEDASLANQLSLNFINRFRNPERLQYAYTKYKDEILTMLPKALYNRLFKNQVTALLNTYEEIESKTDKEAYYEEVYLRAETQYLHSKYWKTTFWKRRALENNDQICHKILLDINNYYNSL
ncbi:hypothetical protein [Yeosuana marina]|uniref:hypothetical protein n=1 Tax=Yeosuana marina TaxID=1565536 RepID=UPI0030C8307B